MPTPTCPPIRSGPCTTACCRENCNEKPAFDHFAGCIPGYQHRLLAALVLAEDRSGINGRHIVRLACRPHEAPPRSELETGAAHGKRAPAGPGPGQAAAGGAAPKTTRAVRAV